MAQTQAKRREREAEAPPALEPRQTQSPTLVLARALAPEGGGHVRECVSCRRAALSAAVASGSIAWMCRAALESRHGPITGPVAPDLCPICIDAIG